MRVDAFAAKPALLGVLAASFLVGVFPGRACQYCRMAATDPEAAKMAAQLHAGGFPLDGTLSQFQPVAPSATLVGPPASGSVAMSASDLPVNSRLTSAKPMGTAVGNKPASPQLVTRVGADSSVAAPKPTARHWADVGLLGLLGAGGWFCWRTRRVSAPVA